MRSVAKLTRRFVGILSLSTLLLLAVNLVILVVLAAYQTRGPGRGQRPEKPPGPCAGGRTAMSWGRT